MVIKLNIPIDQDVITLASHWGIREKILFNGKLVSAGWTRGLKSVYRFRIERNGHSAQYEVVVTTTWRGEAHCMIKEDGREIHNQLYVFHAGKMVPKEERQLPAEPKATPTVDPGLVSLWLTRQRQQQNLATGMLGGLLAAFVGAMIWTAVTAITQYQVGWMAVLLGMAVGATVRLVGHGVDRVFQITAAALALLGCLFGNLLTGLIPLAPVEGIPVLGLLLRLTPYGYYWMLSQTFHPLDVLFYWLAAHTAYALSVMRYQTPEVLPVQPTTTPV